MSVYAFANLGRAKHVEQVKSSMLTIRDTLDRFGAAVLCLNEIDEGDKTKPDDHTLLRRYFRFRGGWRKAHMRRRDPILALDLALRQRRWFRAAGGVPHQSPARQINEAVHRQPDGPDVAVITGHYPAGAYNGQRPERIRAALLAGYDRMLTIHRERIKHHHRAGRHVVWAMDCNWRAFPALHRAEVQLAHHGPDYIRAIPAPGWTVSEGRGGEVHLDIEALHHLLWVEPEWKEAS